MVKADSLSIVEALECIENLEKQLDFRDETLASWKVSMDKAERREAETEANLSAAEKIIDRYLKREAVLRKAFKQITKLKTQLSKYGGHTANCDSLKVYYMSWRGEYQEQVERVPRPECGCGWDEAMKVNKEGE